MPSVKMKETNIYGNGQDSEVTFLSVLQSQDVCLS